MSVIDDRQMSMKRWYQVMAGRTYLQKQEQGKGGCPKANKPILRLGSDKNTDGYVHELQVEFRFRANVHTLPC